jgi:DNA-binding MarR family transcriptional regulator
MQTMAVSGNVTEAIQRPVDWSGPTGPSAEALWSLLVAADYLRGRMDAVCAGFRVTTSQFSVLRILRAACPDGYSRNEIARRMIDRSPDVTRLVDRLEQQQFVERARSSEDRRLSVTRITDLGLRLLSRVEPEIRNLERSCFCDSLSEQDCADLLRICRLIRPRTDARQYLDRAVPRSTVAPTAGWPSAVQSRPLSREGF